MSYEELIEEARRIIDESGRLRGDFARQVVDALEESEREAGEWKKITDGCVMAVDVANAERDALRSQLAEVKSAGDAMVEWLESMMNISARSGGKSEASTRIERWQQPTKGIES